jgi:hypothetical protein
MHRNSYTPYGYWPLHAYCRHGIPNHFCALPATVRFLLPLTSARGSHPAPGKVVTSPGQTNDQTKHPRCTEYPLCKPPARSHKASPVEVLNRPSITHAVSTFPHDLCIARTYLFARGSHPAPSKLPTSPAHNLMYSSSTPPALKRIEAHCGRLEGIALHSQGGSMSRLFLIPSCWQRVDSTSLFGNLEASSGSKPTAQHVTLCSLLRCRNSATGSKL